MQAGRYDVDYNREVSRCLLKTLHFFSCFALAKSLVTAGLFQVYRTARDYAAAPAGELAQAVRRIGLFRNKAKNIQAASRRLLEHHAGEVPRTMAELVALEGVGRKTANVVLGSAFDLQVGVVVDTHVARLCGRLRLTRETNPVKIERALMQLVPPIDWTRFSHWLIWHGRRRCTARRPDCAGCEIRALCPSAGAAPS